MDKKQMARMAMLREMSKKKSSEMHSASGEKLKAKKGLQKVTVIADDKKDLEKGLSKAQQILKAKLGEKLLNKKADEEEELEDDDLNDDEELEEEEEEAEEEDEDDLKKKLK